VADSSIWDEILDTRHVQVLRTYIERWPRRDKAPEKVLIVVVEPDDEARNRCPHCGNKGVPVEFDVRRWRTLDVHGKKCFPECRLPRIDCAEHGKITAKVPWARHDDYFSMPFEDHSAWLAAQMPWTKASAGLRITWEALANIVTRVTADAPALAGRLDGLRMTGIDEKSWGKGAEKFLTVVTDHETGKIAWIAEGRSQESVTAFFDQFGTSRPKLLTHVSADGAEWIHDVVRAKAPQALICLDAFHIVKWAGERLDELRRRLAAELRAAGSDDQAATLGKGMREIRKKPQNLTAGQRTALAGIARDNKQLYKGYLIKEQLREALRARGAHGKALLAGVIFWAVRSRIPEFAKLAKTLRRFLPLIWNTLGHGPSNGRAEALNAQLNALITRARGFRSAGALIAMADFVYGGLCPDSPY
jgi:transposase